MERSVIITHSDADGIISAYLMQKLVGNAPIVFSSPNAISKSIESVKNKKIKLIVLDISPNQDAVNRLKDFKDVLWIDHHEKQEIKDIPANAKIVLKQTLSTAEAISQEFSIKDLNEKLIRMANEIDTNNVKSEDAERLRDYINYIHGTAKGIIFVPMAQQLVKRLEHLSFLSMPEVALNVVAHKIKEKEKADSIKPNVVEIRNEKVAFVEPRSNVPVYEVYNKVQSDYLIVFFRKGQGTKIEFRTHTNKDVLKIAKIFKGGGHLHAAGAFTDNKNVSNIKKKIVNFIKKKI